MKRPSGFCVVLSFFLIAAGAAHAQIVWQSTNVSQNYTGLDTDIKSNGSFAAAVTEADGYPSATYPIVVSDADTTFDLNNDSYITNINGGGSDGDHSTATAYQSALNGVAYAFSPGTFTFSLANLNPNDVYQVQIWDVDLSTSRTTTYVTSGTAGTTTATVYNGFVVGTISGESSQSITVEAAQTNGVGEVNAVSLRDLGAVPEPSTYAMMLGGLALLGFCVRRKLA